MKIIAHRGASGDYPENTLIAFEQAIKQGADGIELDVQYHPSGEWFVLHDLYVDKMTDYSGLLTNLSSDEIDKLKVDGGESLPTLLSSLKVISARCLVNIEIKTPQVEQSLLAEALTLLKYQLESAVTELGYREIDFIISSFNHPCIEHVKTIMPTISTAALIAHCPRNYAEEASVMQVDALNPAIDCLNKELIDDAQLKGLAVWVYTVDRQEDIAQCYHWGVDAIFTNYPLKTREILKKIKSLP